MLTRMKLRIGFIVILIAICSGWYWYEFVFPLKEFGREIQFPNGTQIVSWQSSAWGVKGKFKIAGNEVNEFVTRNQLSDGGFVGSAFLIAHHCIHDGYKTVELRLSKATGIVEIEIIGPDFSGDKVCSAN